jgi:hypothetical protein
LPPNDLESRYTLAQCVEHVLLYLDFATYANNPGGSQAPLAALAYALTAEIDSGRVEIVFFHQRGRGWLETQQMMETHCIWRYRGVARWAMIV